MLKILLFSPKGAGHHYYGPGMSAYRMYNTLDREEVQVTLVHGSPEQEDLESFHEQYFISEIVNKNIYLGAKFLLQARKWVKENAHRFDVVHVLTAFQHSFMFAVWCEREGLPAFIKIGQSDHTGFYQNSIYSKILGLKRYRHNHANTITGYISISNEIEQKLRKAGIQKEKIHNIPNGVDVKRFRPADQKEKSVLRKNLGINDCFTVVFTGAFAERKNPYLVAQAFREFAKNKQAQLLLLGPDLDEGIQREKIKKLMASTHADNIHVHNHVNDVENYYRASDVFVLPSSEEGFSNSMLEAQACGLPAIVTRISGSEDLIDETKNGTFIERTPSTIATALNDYYNHQKKLENQSQQSRTIILNNYSSESVLEQHIQLFSREIKKGN